MTEKLCVKCQAAPAYVGPNRTYSYCEACDGERKRADYLANYEQRLTEQRARTAKYRQNTGPRTCPRCKATHTDGGSDNYCKSCRRAYHRERRNDPKVREAINARQRAHYHANAEHEKKLRRGYRDKIKRAALDAYGGVCACCGETRLEFLAIDHINGGGKQHRAQVIGGAGGGARFYRWLRDQGWPQGELRVLCHNCNQSLGYHGYCPHERERTNQTH